MSDPMTTHISLRNTSLLVALLSIGIYAFFSFFYPFNKTEYSGIYIYDYYYQAILDGQLNLPLRLVAYEGHYLPDGTAYTYHGLAPLLTRFAFGWLLPADGSFFPYASPLFWCAIGSASYHVILHKLLRSHFGHADHLKTTTICAGALVWLLSPGLFLAGNSSFYVEPIAVAYAATGVFFLAVFANSRGEMTYVTTVLICALCIALALHARPHVAIGLAAGLGLLGVRGLLHANLRFVIAFAVAGVVIATSASGYLYVNYLKFGDPMEAHGGFSPDDRVQMGTVFLGQEEYGSERAQGFEQFGRFNPARIPGNLVAYTLDAPNPVVHSAVETILQQQEKRAGYVRLEPPFLGIGLLWAVWLTIAAIGLRRKPTFHEWVMGLSGAAIAIMVLSYPTITFRYRSELWPLVMALVITSMPTFLSRLDRAKTGSLSSLTITIVAVSLLIGFNAAIAYSYSHRNPQGQYVLDKDFCIELVSARFDRQKTSQLCADWKDQ